MFWTPYYHHLMFPTWSFLCSESVTSRYSHLTVSGFYRIFATNSVRRPGNWLLALSTRGAGMRYFSLLSTTKRITAFIVSPVDDTQQDTCVVSWEIGRASCR